MFHLSRNILLIPERLSSSSVSASEGLLPSKQFEVLIRIVIGMNHPEVCPARLRVVFELFLSQFKISSVLEHLTSSGWRGENCKLFTRGAHQLQYFAGQSPEREEQLGLTRAADYRGGSK